MTKDDFHELLFNTLTSQDFNLEKANQLQEARLKILPQFLYRYYSFTDKNGNDLTSPEGKNTFHSICTCIEENKVRLSSPDSMNDLYDSSLSTTLDQIRIQSMLKDLQSHPDLSKIITTTEFETLHYLSNNQSSFLNELSLITAKYQPFIGDKSKLAKAFEQTIQESFDRMDNQTHVRFRALKSKIKLFCLSERWDSLPMWAHYASNHSGICIEYDIKKIGFEIISRMINPIKYCDDMPNLTSLIFDKDKIATFILQIASIHKCSDWSYEKEWRYYIPDDSVNYSYGWKATKIIYSKNLNERHKEKLISLCQTNNIELHGMELQRNSYKPELIKVL
ncbi:MAG: DUF2971 domain-containing protein [Candidatus Caenarcaniphilales bacterium]|nr:DUF2971 domain-containing protein [Candidatus Caenarcaniphilales bacterium]